MPPLPELMTTAAVGVIFEKPPDMLLEEESEMWEEKENDSMDEGAQEDEQFEMAMMISLITIKSSLVPLIEGLYAQVYFRFEISVVCTHLLLFFFVKGKI